MPSDNVSSFYNLFVLRRLFNKDNAGKGVPGETRRVSLHTTVSPMTFIEMTKVVPTGKGKYSAPVVEMGIRMQLAALGTLSMETVAEEMALAFLDREGLAKRLILLGNKIMNYSST